DFHVTGVQTCALPISTGPFVGESAATERGAHPMHEDFWRARWQRNEIGFHLTQVNPWLQRHWEAAAGARVLVPLCGKSLDMAWRSEERRGGRGGTRGG